MQNYFEKTNISLYHDHIFLNVKFSVAVACSRSLESGVRREVGEQKKKGAGGGGGREREGERWFFLLPSLCAGEGLEHAKVAVILR